MSKPVDPVARREALAALVAHLGEEPDLEEVVAAESQLFPGVLMIGQGAAYFLCRRFGAWEVMTEFSADELKSVEAVPSFGAQGHEVRLLHRGRLIRFSDLDEEAATRIAAALEREGGEALDDRGKARRVRAAGGRGRAAGPLGATPALPTTHWTTPGTSAFANAGAAASSPFTGPALGTTSLPSNAFTSAAAASAPRALDDDEIGQVDDDDAESDDDDADDDDDIFEQLERGGVRPDEAAALAQFDRAAEAARAKTKPKAKPQPAEGGGAKRKLLFPIILVGVVYGVTAPMVHMVAWETFARDPEIGFFALPAATWALIGLIGGIFGGGLGRGLTLAFVGLIAGSISGAAFRHLLGAAPWTSFPALALLGYVYVSLRKGKSPLMKGLVAAFGALIAFGMFEVTVPGPTAMFGVAIFWGIHYLWERADA